MIYQNEIFKFEDRQLRLLYANSESGRAYVIDVYEKFAWPFELPMELVGQQQALEMDGEV
jgi:hypothetical protein